MAVKIADFLLFVLKKECLEDEKKIAMSVD